VHCDLNVLVFFNLFTLALFTDLLVLSIVFRLI